jgi:hypothetical protein
MANITEANITELSQFIHTYLSTPNLSGYIPKKYLLPISELDGIKVNVYLVLFDMFHDDVSYGIRIEHFFWLNTNGDDGNYLHLYGESKFNSVHETLHFLVNEFIPNFTIDVINGKFDYKNERNNNEQEDRIVAEFCKNFENNERVTLVIQKCCVCYQMTKCKTECKHSICIKCANQINFKREYGEETGFLCPLCRTLCNSIIRTN